MGNRGSGRSDSTSPASHKNLVLWYTYIRKQKNKKNLEVKLLAL